MDYRSLIQQSTDYIEEHVKDPLTVERLAEQVGFSPYHYYRIFGEYVGMPVMDFIRRRRMLHAGYDLCTKDARILDVALDLSLIHISEPTRLGMISYAVFCLKK